MTPLARFAARLWSGGAGRLLVYLPIASVGLALAALAGLFGLPLALVLCGAHVSYCFEIVERVALGRPVPLLSYETINPAHNLRPLILVLLVLLGLAAGGHLLRPALETLAGRFLALGALSLVPAVLALLCVDDSWPQALSPRRVLGLVRALGITYAALLGLVGVELAALHWLSPHVPALWLIPAVGFASLSLSAALGCALYAKRTELGLEAWSTPERHAAVESAAAARETEGVVDDMHFAMRAGNLAGAWKRASEWIVGRGTRPADLRNLITRTADWPDRRIADRLTAMLVRRHLRYGESEQAVSTLNAWRIAGGQFEAQTARELGRLIGLARLGEHHALAEWLLVACSVPYREDPEIRGLLERRRDRTA